MKIVVFNVENLFLHLDLYQGEDFTSLSEEQWQKMTVGTNPLKPLTKVLQMAEHLKNLEPDILLLSEVGGKTSLDNFNRYFLNDQFIPLIIEGNSDRGIDLGHLVNKKLPFQYQLKSHKDRPLNFRYPRGDKAGDKFSRDVLELRIFPQSQTSSNSPSCPLMIILAVHLKSKLDKEGIDPNGRQRRMAEVKTLLEIYQEIDREYSGQVPILIGGDFNGHASLPYPDPEFAEIYRQTSLMDALELAGKVKEERITHLFFHSFGLIEKFQFDYLFLPSTLQSYVIPDQTKVCYFNLEKNLPSSRKEQGLLPSDHFPLLLTLQDHFLSCQMISKRP